MEYYLIRHPKPATPPDICYGKTDVELADETLPEAIIIAKELKSKNLEQADFYASPLQRCKKLAEKIAKILDININYDSRIEEFNFGIWENKNWSEIPREVVDQMYFKPFGFCSPKGECFNDFVARIQDFYNDINKKQKSQVVVFTHCGVLKISDYLLNGVPVCEAIAREYQYANLYKFSN